MPVLATYRNGVYDFFLLLHILCAVVGFGAVFLNGLYAQEIKKRPGPEGLAVFEANFRVSKIGEYFIYAVFVLGFVVLALAKIGDTKVFEFSQTWVWLSIVLYIVGIGISHGVLWPSVKKIPLSATLVIERPPMFRLPPIARSISASLGCGLLLSNAAADMICPDWQ